MDDSAFVPSIVLNSLFTEDSIWLIKLNTSSSAYIPDSKSEPITDATIIITEPNGTSECKLLHTGNGEYRSKGCLPKSEKNYNIIVSSPKYGIVTASSSIPKNAKVTVQDAKIVNDETIINFTVEQTSILEDFYIWDLVEVKYAEDGDTSKIKTKPSGPLNIQNWIDNINTEITHIKDRNLTSTISAVGYGDAGSTFNETIKTRSILINPPQDTSSVTYKTKTMLRVMTVSKELYQYFKSIEYYLGYKDYNTSFHEPYSVFNNVKGGVGIFAGFSVEYADIPQ